MIMSFSVVFLFVFSRGSPLPYLIWDRHFHILYPLRYDVIIWKRVLLEPACFLILPEGPGPQLIFHRFPYKHLLAILQLIHTFLYFFRHVLSFNLFYSNKALIDFSSCYQLIPDMALVDTQLGVCFGSPIILKSEEIGTNRSFSRPSHVALSALISSLLYHPATKLCS